MRATCHTSSATSVESMIRWPIYSGRYERAFRAAERFTKRLGFDPRTLAYSRAPLLDDGRVNRITAVAQSQLGHLAPEDVAHACAMVSQSIKGELVREIRSPMSLTIGYVESGGHVAYRFTRSEVRRLLNATAVTPRRWSFHAWLTLPSMELIDATLATTYAVENGDLANVGGLIMRHADRLRGMRYFPVIVGDEIVSALAGGWRVV